MIISQSVTLNVSYQLPSEIWQSISHLYEQLPGWQGFKDDIPYWFGNEEDPEYVWASVEPSGLLISGKLDAESWEKWIATFTSGLSDVLGYEVQDADG